MADYTDTLLPGVLVARSGGLDDGAALRAGLLGSVIGGGQLPMTFAVTTLLTRRARRTFDAAPSDGDGDDGEIEGKRDDQLGKIHALAQSTDKSLSSLKSEVGKLSGRVDAIDKRVERIEGASGRGSSGSSGSSGRQTK